ncbi:MAG: hypothetical protein LCH88_09060 [Proteobacteria bacterium]|nr:hypothetical protein [Pseudomonadota bacterium]
MRPEDRLNERQIASARRLLAAGYSMATIAARFGYTTAAMRRALDQKESAA